MAEFSSVVADPIEYLPRAVPGSPVDAGGGMSTRVEALISYAAMRGFVFEPWQIASFVTAVRTKPFVILAGISGTGKTKLPQLVAEATDAESIVVPVRPDWTDSSELLGYERLNGSFVPGHLLQACKRAIAEPDRQFFFILDEMNVARVEYYFAEVLSLMENRYRDDSGTIRTAPLTPNAPNEWALVWLPSNVCLVGTVNMDESTHGFSRKVLDRSFVIELSEVDLSRLDEPEGSSVLPPTWSAADWRVEALTLFDSGRIADPLVIEVVQALTRANEALAHAQLQVGYRVRDEVALFCLRAASCASSFVGSGEAVVSPLDLCISMKVLPRVQGGDAAIAEVLSDLATWVNARTAADEFGEEPSGFPRTAERLTLMQTRLERTGFTSYWI